jgi:hypothetical protein
MFRFLMIVQTAWVMLMMGAQAQPLTVDPESVVPLPDRFELETPAADIAPAFVRFQGAWIGSWYDDVRTILVMERVKHGAPDDGHLLRLSVERWQPMADELLASLVRQGQ